MEIDAINSREMHALETNAEYFGISRLQLMENAGCSIASEISARFPSRKTRVAVFCGLGGNGGDGFVTARHLNSLGYRVEVILAGRSSAIAHEEARKNWSALKSLDEVLVIHEVKDSSEVPEVKADVVIDALLGIGLKGPPQQPFLCLLEKINNVQAFCVAADVPTGLDSDSGKVLGQAVKADLTITFHKAKPGLLDAKEYVGELIVKTIGLPIILERFAGPGDVNLVVKSRPAESHKGDFGKLLVVGGSENYSGAPALAALSAYRTGVDLVYVAAPEKTANIISTMSPNLITKKLDGSHLNPANVSQIEQDIRNVNAMLVGPGLGVHEETKETVEKIVATAEVLGKPLLLDADGLKAFAGFKRPLKTSLVLTPHAGEYSILTGKKLPSSIEERADKVKKTAAKLGAVILLKGKTDIISDSSKVKFNFSGNAGMTVGGTGDVLSGIVGALLAQDVDAFKAAVAGAFINGAAGDFVRRDRGYHMVATDLLEWVPRIIDDPMAHLKVRECSLKV